MSTEGAQQPAPEYPPFMVLFDEEDPSIPLPDDYILPSKYTFIDQKLSLATDKSNFPETALCPELRTENQILKEALRSLQRIKPGTIKGCLFAAQFREGEDQVCQKEPKRRLTVVRDLKGKRIICGTAEKQRLVSAEYKACGSVQYFKKYHDAASIARAWGTEEPQLLPQVYEMYEICYDFENKRTLWTKHKVLTPELLTHKEYPHRNLNTVNLDEFDTEKFSLSVPEQTFTVMKHDYESADVNMKIYPLVPKDHMALPYWKKSTDHMINSAPLLPEFIPLMKAIHNGILLASKYVLREFHETLTIYTKAETILSLTHLASSALYLESAMKYLVPELSIEVFTPNTWYIIVHNEDANSAVLIVLHNTREDPPEQKECDDGVRLPCNFQNWSEDPHSITEKNLEYVYCCPIRPEKVRTLFLIHNLEISKDFNIEEMIRLEHDEEFDKKNR
ncbi:uncharacterized protein LOC135833686 [Planococcus citri]|uniref:uncharacterized protein LOC135833686 n=1 Tax=Planococcus citri TaxID=170843 RepID=UPI0031F7CA14